MTTLTPLPASVNAGSPVAPRRSFPARPVTSRPAALDWPASPEVDGFTWELGPDAADDRWNAEQSTEHHFDGPTPDEVLAPPAPFDADELAEVGRRSDALPLGHPSDCDCALCDDRHAAELAESLGLDDRAEESAALDRLCAGCLL
jgi:hypothetical protein